MTLATVSWKRRLGVSAGASLIAGSALAVGGGATASTYSLATACRVVGCAAESCAACGETGTSREGVPQLVSGVSNFNRKEGYRGARGRRRA